MWLSPRLPTPLLLCRCFFRTSSTGLYARKQEKAKSNQHSCHLVIVWTMAEAGSVGRPQSELCRLQQRRRLIHPMVAHPASAGMFAAVAAVVAVVAPSRERSRNCEAALIGLLCPRQLRPAG